MKFRKILAIILFLLFLISCVVVPEQKSNSTKEVKSPEPVKEPKSVLKALLEKASQAKEVFVSYDSEEMLSSSAKATYNSTLFIKDKDFRRDALIEYYFLEDNSWNLEDSQALMEIFSGEIYTKCVISEDEEGNCVENNITEHEKKEYMDALKDQDVINNLDKYTVILLPSQTINGELLACFRLVNLEGLESTECYSEKTGFLTTYKTATETRSLKTLEFTVPEDAFN